MRKKLGFSRILKCFALVLFSAFLFNSSYASGESEGKFNAGEMIIHHVSDAHEIHIIGDFAIYLPIIIYDGGLKMFSSSHFYHNPKEVEISGKHEHYYEHNGYILYHEKVYLAPNGIELNEDGSAIVNEAAFDLSITKSVAGLLLVLIIMTFIFIQVARVYKRREGMAPKGFQTLIEQLILFIRDDVVRPSIGHKADKFLPFLLTVFFFIWISNMLGLIPFIGGFNITGTISVTMVLAALVFIITTIKGNKHYWMHILWPPGVPFLVKLILIPVEIMSVFIKPFVLMVRLTANITAGHIIILAFVSLIFIFGESGAGAGYGAGVFSTIFMMFMNVIELLVAFLQAYVFTLLAALYFGAAVEEAHH